jgi:hypothetical protein
MSLERRVPFSVACQSAYVFLKEYSELYAKGLHQSKYIAPQHDGIVADERKL